MHAQQDNPNSKLEMFVSGYVVKYDYPPPYGAITDIRGYDNNINRGFGKCRVYIVPKFTTNVNDACTGFISVSQAQPDDKYSDLAKGAGGNFRYLLPILNLGTGDKITELGLYRSQSPISGLPDGYTGRTNNINDGRKGDYLYVIWKTSYTPIKTFVFPNCKPNCNQSDDINSKFKGSHVWIVPSYSPHEDIAVTDFKILIQSKENAGYQDLARGSGGDYRYCVPVIDPFIFPKVTELRLLRSDKEISVPPKEFKYQKMSTDINKGRGNSFLYLIWKEA